MNDTALTSRWSAIRAKSLARRARQAAPQSGGIDTSTPPERHAEKKCGSEIARPRTREDRKTLFEKIAASLADVLTDEDLERVANVYRDALGAKQRFWIDEGKDEFGKSIGHWEWQDDHKTRIQAANMIAAYKEGLPVQRQVVLTKAFESADETIKKIKDSPELLKAIQTLQGGGLALEAGGEIIDIESEELR